jgi:DNA-binding LacI/PurR family transcriptional regulator
MAITMREVAKEAGVSIATVSYVLAQRPDVAISRSTREQVLRVARRLNYRHNALAADLRRGATRMVGIHLYALGVPIVARKIAALERGLRAGGVYPFLCHAIDPDAEQTFFKECLSRRACGIVLTGRPGPASVLLLARLQAEGAVVVSFEPVPDLAVPYVTVDRAGGAEIAVRHLLALGHRRIGVVVGFTEHVGRGFHEAYRQALTGGGVPFEPNLALDLIRDLSHYEEGDRAAHQLLALPQPPTAILTTDDAVAIGVMRGVQRQGRRVPEDVAVVGCDDLPAAAYDIVPLTTLAQPAEEGGTRLAELLIDGLKDPRRIMDVRTALPMRLVVRQSCGAAMRGERNPPAAAPRYGV